jgi:hypothetical protein
VISPIEGQLGRLRQNLDLRPDEIDISGLLPIFVPSSFCAVGNWVGPFSRLRAAEIGLTWSVLFPNQTMRYVDSNLQEFWEAQGLDWKTRAMDNLGDRTNSQPAGIRQMRKPTGELSVIAFMFVDGYGPSRLLFRGGLSERFPQGYRVALPEMSSGFAFAKDLAGPDLETTLSLIDRCYRKGTRPLSPVVYDPDDLLPL